MPAYRSHIKQILYRVKIVLSSQKNRSFWSFASIRAIGDEPAREAGSGFCPDSPVVAGNRGPIR